MVSMFVNRVRMRETSISRRTSGRLRLVPLLALLVGYPQFLVAGPSATPSIDGTYELTQRVMSGGTVLKPPLVSGLYTLRRGRFHLNLFFVNSDGTIASESTNGHYTFNSTRYCEWVDYTIRNNLDKPGVTTEAPVLEDHCAPVISKNGRFNFSPPGEGVATSFGRGGFTARLGTEFVDHWRKIE
jgi:hypothetical protein